ncbi:MAG: ATP synthase F0 subunit B [Butyricicoccus pullicaecorum]
MLLNINANVIWTVVGLLILFLLMKKFLFGPVTAMLDQRAAAINADLDDAKAQKQAADVLLADHERQIGEARAGQAALWPMPSVAPRQLMSRNLRGAGGDSAHAAAGRSSDQADRRAMLAQTRREIARLSLLAASKVAQRRMDADNEFALVVTSVGNGGCVMSKTAYRYAAALRRTDCRADVFLTSARPLCSGRAGGDDRPSIGLRENMRF